MGLLSSFYGGNKIQNLDAESFEEKIQNDSEAVILDVRTMQEFVNARIPNSILIDIYSHEFIRKIEKLDRAKSYYIYCHSGGRSYSAVNEMMKIGFRNLYNLENGIISWSGKIERG